MVKYTPASELRNQIFKTPFDATLDPTNRWVQMEQIVPWDEMAAVLSKRMSHLGKGSVDLRYVLGAMLIKGLENLSDEDVLLQIQENIYMQYFVGLRNWQKDQLFTPEVLVSVRKRLGEEGMSEMNDLILKISQGQVIKHRAPYGSRVNTQDKAVQNRGILKVDATVAPEDIRYPTDTSLLNDARLFTEEFIDELFELIDEVKAKPRTYRRVAKQKYLRFSKRRRPGQKQIKTCKKQQLQYVRRNIGHIHKMLDTYERKNGIGLPNIRSKTYRSWLVVQHIYDQQNRMYTDKRKKIKDRIVSLQKPWVRPIVRGKAGKQVEFGSKLNVSETEGMLRVDQIDFNNYNESKGLEGIVEGYKSLYSYYPEGVLVDKIYLTRENRKMLKERDIAHYGPQLGRQTERTKAEKIKRKKKQNKRSEIEGKFGLAKMKFGLNRIMMKRSDTSKAHIQLIAISMNICKLWQIFWSFFGLLREIMAYQKLKWRIFHSGLLYFFQSAIYSSNMDELNPKLA